MNSHDAAANTQAENATPVKLTKWQRMTPEQRERHIATMARWRERNKDRHRTNLAAYRKSNKSRIDQQKKDWAKRNRSKVNRTRTRWNAANPDKVKAMAKRLIARDKGPCARYLREWRKKNPGKVPEYNQRHYHKDIEKSRSVGVRNTHNRRVREGTVKLSKTILAQRVREQGGKCLYCPVVFGVVKATVEHLIPVCRGGTNDEANIAASCKSCNSRKHHRTHDEFLALLASELAQ